MRQWQHWYRSLNAVTQKRYTAANNNVYYNLSCTYALLHQPAAALCYLDTALQYSYADYQHLVNDSDLVSLHQLARFKALVQPLRAVGDYLFILKTASVYDNTVHSNLLPAFTYQSPADTALIALRRYFHLDSIAGTGNQTEQVLNLLHWVHNLVPHDGNTENPPVRDALHLVSVCRKEGRGLNCRGLATVLNECYLAMGFKSRLVTCLPKDSLGIDPDCHVINSVYVPALHKWIWADPTNDAYVMNEKGELLGIEEVRARLINGEPLILNPDANWNHRFTRSREEYLYGYMAKNLYLLQCPVNSIAGNETRMPGKVISYIQLNPVAYFRQKQNGGAKSGTQQGDLLYYNTNNAAAFWQAP
ncbi:TPR end-of-group domain-containing protein [Deminuibacter soli]|uniref:TPR end-of-group domain-containing protein n=1 Tax=Deminuibacter soli TaxID=2291815 RepID=UPI003744A4F2